ncbi:MAG: RDD family protein [Neptuniibacter sp.]
MTEHTLEIQNKETDLLASRWSRLWAALIDCLIAVATTIPLMSYLDVWALAFEGHIPIDVTIKLAVLSWLLFFLIHGYFLKEKGQTVGKMILGIAIVTLDGHKPEFIPLVLKRYLPMMIIGYIPLIGQYLSITEVLFIFRKDKRCIHDLIAGTKVINANRAD